MVALRVPDAAPARVRRRGFRFRFAITIGVLAVASAASMVLATSIGPVSVPFGRTARIVFDHLGLGSFGADAQERSVITQIRLPRVLVAMLVGSGLGLAGAVMQAVFRNPLAEPGVVGVSSGAALGAVAAIYFGWTEASRWALPGAAQSGHSTGFLPRETVRSQASWGAFRRRVRAGRPLTGLITGLITECSRNTHHGGKPGTLAGIRAVPFPLAVTT